MNYSPEFNATEPNLSLLRRLAENGDGKMLNPANPADNQFFARPGKTFQPRDLWEWLLKLAVVQLIFNCGTFEEAQTMAA